MVLMRHYPDPSRGACERLWWLRNTIPHISSHRLPPGPRNTCDLGRWYPEKCCFSYLLLVKQRRSRHASYSRVASKNFCRVNRSDLGDGRCRCLCAAWGLFAVAVVAPRWDKSALRTAWPELANLYETQTVLFNTENM